MAIKATAQKPSQALFRSLLKHFIGEGELALLPFKKLPQDVKEASLGTWHCSGCANFNFMQFILTYLYYTDKNYTI